MQIRRDCEFCPIPAAVGKMVEAITGPRKTAPLLTPYEAQTARVFIAPPQVTSAGQPRAIAGEFETYGMTPAEAEAGKEKLRAAIQAIAEKKPGAIPPKPFDIKTVEPVRVAPATPKAPDAEELAELARKRAAIEADFPGLKKVQPVSFRRGVRTIPNNYSEAGQKQEYRQ